MTRIIEIIQRSGGVASAQAAAAAAQTSATAAAASAAELDAALPTPTVDDNVGLLLEVRVSGVVTTRQVTVGAEDSGGTGFRLLRVPN